jgi:hypothetical protein
MFEKRKEIAELVLAFWGKVGAAGYELVALDSDPRVGFRR